MLKIESIAVIGEELAIAWSDAQESYLSFKKLRESCPCANCQGEPDALGRVELPTVYRGPRANVLLSYEEVGGYAIQFKWGDGHSTGIYGFAFLRALGK